MSLWGSRVGPKTLAEPIKAPLSSDPEAAWPTLNEHRWFRPSHLEPDANQRVRNQQRLPRRISARKSLQNQRPQAQFHHTRLGRGVVRAPGKLWDPLRGWVDAPPGGSRQVWVKKRPQLKTKEEEWDEEESPVEKVAKEFCEDTSLHGVQYLGDKNWCERYLKLLYLTTCKRK
jgi:hypothetical protein